MSLTDIGPLFAFLCVVGAIATTRFLRTVLSFVWLHALRPRTSYVRYGAKNGAWAVVSGPTGGIGLAMADALAARGFNIFLIGRNLEKLRPVQKSIEETHHVRTQTIQVDCADVSPKTFELISSAVADLDISVLVNNVGVSVDVPVKFEEMTDDQIRNAILVNCLFTTKLTQTLLPKLKRRRSARGLILTLSSTTGLIPTPLLSIYAATKVFDDFFSCALSAELADSNIDAISLVPGFIVSAMSGFKKPKFLVPSAERFANDTLDKVSSSRRRMSPYWPHDLYWSLVLMLPTSFVIRQARKQMEKTRAHILARQHPASDRSKKRA